jgi:hypothetical protein
MIEIKSVKKVVWLLIALVLVWGFTAIGARGASTPTSSGLIAYYSFDGDVVDHLGNGNDGMNNGATFVTGKSGKALSFDGANSYVLAHISGSVPKSLTLEAWIYPKAGGVVFSELGQGTINSGWHDSQMEVLTTGETKVGIWTGGSMGGVSLGTYPFNSWHHVVMTYDNNNNIIEGYVDGSLIKSATYTKTYPDDLWYAIGASDYTNLGSGAYFSGLIDEIRIYSRALSQAEIQANMNSSTAPGGPAPPAPPAPTGMIRQWASSAVASSEYSPTSWSAAQATGAPNTFDYGDIATAWVTPMSLS